MRIKRDELKQLYTDPVFLEKFKNLFSLRSIFYRSIIKEGYTVPIAIGEAIILTDYGQQLYEKLKKGKFGDQGDHVLKFGLLMEFYHKDLIIDVFKTDISAIEALLNEQVLNNSLIHPWTYGRLLYDKYFETFNDQEKVLKPAEVTKLLDKTPKGVFQIGNYIIGSLGLLKSSVTRFLPPIRTVKLWHCSDPSCTKFHEVHFASGDSIMPELISEIDHLLRTEISSEWEGFYFDLIEHEDFYYDVNRIIRTPYLFINTFGDSEIKSLLKEVIDNDKSFRAKLPSDKSFKGSSDDIVKLIEKDVCFQLLLLGEDEMNIESIEKLIDVGIIVIPATEIRRPTSIVVSGFFRIHHECNQLGVRSVSTTSNLCLRQLNNLLTKIYSEQYLQQQLEWKLRHYEGETLKEKIGDYTIKEEPKKIIRETILSGPTQVAQTFKYLFGYFKMPTTIAEEERLINKILWKLGFDINIYPNQLEKFWERLQNFKETTRSCTAFTDTDKEKIRSSAVNFWISLEEILEQTLSFVTWTLLSDHFRNTHFKYNFEEARDFMCEKLHGHRVGSTEALMFDNKGKNTLFPLTEGFTALLQICDRLLEEGIEKHKRDENDMPSFWHKAELVSFPFESKIFLLDVKSSNYKLLAQLLAEIPRTFNQNGVLSVRNKTQHKRDDFPSQDEILNACNAVENVVNKLEINGIYPNVFLFKSTTVDKFNRVNHEFEDYKGRNVSLKPTFEFAGSRLPDARRPQIIIPILKIGNSHELLRFKYEESSNYLKYWKNFPRRKNKEKKKDMIKHDTVSEIIED